MSGITKTTSAPLTSGSVFSYAKPRPARVVKRTRETYDTFNLTLELLDGQPYTFAPGQFNALSVFGLGEAPISLSGDPERPDVIYHTIREVGRVTRALGALRAGGSLGLRGPFGSEWPMAEARGREVLFIAGGIGLAPLRPAIMHVLAHRADYRQVQILYGARTPEDLLFEKDIRNWKSRLDVSVDVTVDRASRKWFGEVGFVTAALRRSTVDPDNVIVMACGPEVMMRFIARELLGKEIPRDRIYLSMERNMQCGIGWCGHCQYGPHFICLDGPVMSYDSLESLLALREV